MVHSYRARWNLSKVSEIWRLSKWLMFAGIANFTLRKGDEMLAARIGGAQQFGIYNVGADLGQMPTGEVGPALLRSLLPVLSGIQDDIARTNQAVLKTVAAINALTFPIGVLFSVLSLPATLMILGENWRAAAPIVAVFAIISTVQIMLSPVSTLLILRGFTRVQSTVVWLEFAVFLLAAAFWVPAQGVIGLAYARLLGSICNAMAMAVQAHRCCGLQLSALALALLRPFLSAVCLILTALTVLHWLVRPDLQLLVAGALSLVAYLLCTVIAWVIAGRPEGIESTVLDRWHILVQRNR